MQWVLRKQRRHGREVGVAEPRLAGSGKQIPKEVISKLKDEQEKAREVVNKLSQLKGPRERMSHSGTVSTLLETLEPRGFTQNSAYTGRGVLSHLIQEVRILGSQSIHPRVNCQKKK